jgi:hypothetical protein
MATAYKPDAFAGFVLGDIPALFNHPDTEIIHEHFSGEKFMCKLPGGQIYFDSKLALDADGSPYWKQDRPNSQPVTTNHLDDGRDLDSDLINYFVLPGGIHKWKQGIDLGDIAVVIRGVRMAFACFGDVGPRHSLGEGSISLHRDLGNETVSNRESVSGGTFNPKAGIDSGVITIVFPGSGNHLKKFSGRTTRDSTAIGAPLFERLKRDATDYTNLPDI